MENKKEKTKDFALTLIDGNAELQDHYIHTIKDAINSSNGKQTMWLLNSCDVSIEKNISGGNHITRKMFGQETFIGKEEVQKDRQLLINKDLCLPIKVNKRPNVILIFAETFDELPSSIKTHKMFGTLFKLFYDAMERVNREIEELYNRGYNEAEMTNTFSSSSLPQIAEEMSKTLDPLYKTMAESRIRTMPQQQNQQQNPQQQQLY